MPEPAPPPCAPFESRSGPQYADLRRAILFTAGLVVVYQLASPLSTLLVFVLPASSNRTVA